jgi:ankyrin repeat protein
MQAQPHSSAPVPQKFDRPLDVPPGFWKQQLPGKYREIAVRGDLSVLRPLLDEHPEFLNKRGSHNRTLLWEATRSGRPLTVRWLVERGAEIDATGCYNGETLVQITPYCAAVHYGHPDIAEYLLSQGARLDIFRAAFMGEEAIVSSELTAHPERLDAEDPFDPIYYVPLLAFAVAGGRLGVADMLLRRGANVGPYSALLIHLATQASRMDLLELLVAHGADVRAVDTGIYIVASDVPLMRYLLDHGASATRQGKNGYTPLLYITRSDKSEAPEKVELLLEYGASVNEAGPKGKTALHSAAAAGHTRVIKLLLAHGASVTSVDQQGHTPLDLARLAGQAAAVELLTR